MFSMSLEKNSERKKTQKNQYLLKYWFQRSHQLIEINTCKSENEFFSNQHAPKYIVSSESWALTNLKILNYYN